MATQGICRVMNGWVRDDTVWVRHDNRQKFEIALNQYQKEGLDPPFDQLAECEGQQTT